MVSQKYHDAIFQYWCCATFNICTKLGKCLGGVLLFFIRMAISSLSLKILKYFGFGPLNILKLFLSTKGHLKITGVDSVHF